VAAVLSTRAADELTDALPLVARHDQGQQVISGTGVPPPLMKSTQACSLANG
jgi:hypothetical protein